VHDSCLHDVSNDMVLIVSAHRIKNVHSIALQA